MKKSKQQRQQMLFTRIFGVFSDLDHLWAANGKFALQSNVKRHAFETLICAILETDGLANLYEW